MPPPSPSARQYKIISIKQYAKLRHSPPPLLVGQKVWAQNRTKSGWILIFWSSPNFWPKTGLNPSGEFFLLVFIILKVPAPPLSKILRTLVYTALKPTWLYRCWKIIVHKRKAIKLHHSHRVWSNGNAFVSGAGGLRFKFRPGLIGPGVANGSPCLWHFFESSGVPRRRNDAEMGPAYALLASV